MDINFRVNMNSIAQLLSERGLASGGRVQMFIDNEVLRRSNPYMPMQTGLLQKSGILGTKIGSGEVSYNSPYARYLYYGRVMVGRAPKQLTEKDITYHGAPRRGKLWFERMKADHIGGILRGAGKAAGGKAE